MTHFILAVSDFYNNKTRKKKKSVPQQQHWLVND